MTKYNPQTGWWIIETPSVPNSIEYHYCENRPKQSIAGPFPTPFAAYRIESCDTALHGACKRRVDGLSWYVTNDATQLLYGMPRLPDFNVVGVFGSVPDNVVSGPHDCYAAASDADDQLHKKFREGILEEMFNGNI